LLIMLVNSLIEIQALTLNEEYAFNSQGLLKFRKLLKSEFSPSYLLEIKEVLKKLKETKSTYIHAKIGDFLYGEEYRLLDEDSQKKNWFKWLFAPKFELADRDDSGLADLAKRVTLAYFPVSETIKNTAKKVLGFFETLHFEMAYYIGCLNLYETMQNINIEITFPDFSRENMFTDLKDIALTLYSDKEVIANSLAYDDANPIFITGPNQGGKSTFLRSVGQAYLLMQAGLFVTAKSFRAMPANSIFTHFKKEEDRDMENGKLAEELARMSNIINVIEPHSVILFNESFASTNEIEGSEIARQIIEALVEKDIRVVFVTHFYHLAKEFYKNSDYHALFLRAEILSDKQRTFKIVPGSPLPTSNGTDLYESVF